MDSYVFFHRRTAGLHQYPLLGVTFSLRRAKSKAHALQNKVKEAYKERMNKIKLKPNSAPNFPYKTTSVANESYRILPTNDS